MLLGAGGLHPAANLGQPVVLSEPVGPPNKPLHPTGARAIRVRPRVSTGVMSHDQTADKSLDHEQLRGLVRVRPEIRA